MWLESTKQNEKGLNRGYKNKLYWSNIGKIQTMDNINKLYIG